MLFATTIWMPASRSEYGAVSRDDPQPFERPLTITPKPPFLIASFVITPPRRPTRQYRASVSS
jgi:hypothetical protein